MTDPIPLAPFIRFQEQLDDFSEALELLGRKRDDDTTGGMSDDWKESVERRLGQLHDDVRQLLYMLIGGFVFLIVSGVTAYLLLDGKVDTRITKVEERLGAIERKTDVIDMKLDLLLERTKDSTPAKSQR